MNFLFRSKVNNQKVLKIQKKLLFDFFDFQMKINFEKLGCIAHKFSPFNISRNKGLRLKC